MTAPHAVIATPEHRSAHRRTGPLRSGNPGGNPNLAPRCGAKARTTGYSCRAPAMPNGRCRMHGGKSTGPRTPAGFANLARARTTHGLHAQSGPAAELRAAIHHARVTARRVRLNGAAFDLLAWLPPAFAARLRADTATELHAPPRYAKPQTAPAAANPADHPPATATLQPPAHTPHPRRDASGRFAPPPPRPLRGRQAERAQARAEATALAPWRLAIVQARTAMRQAQTAKRAKPRTALAASGQENSAPAPARPLPQNARFANPRIYPMEPETQPPGPTSPSETARFANLRIYPMEPETGPPPTAPAETADACRAKTAIQRGTVAPPAGPGTAAGEASTKTSMRSLPPGTCPGGGTGGRTATSPATLAVPAAPDLRSPIPPAATQPGRPACEPPGKGPIQSLPPGACPGGGTVTAGANPFRNALLASTVSNTPDAHQLAAQVERAGGWPVIIASNAATQAGKDWRPAATAARQRLADDAIRARSRCILRLAPLADPARTDRPPGVT